MMKPKIKPNQWLFNYFIVVVESWEGPGHLIMTYSGTNLLQVNKYLMFSAKQ